MQFSRPGPDFEGGSRSGSREFEGGVVDAVFPPDFWRRFIVFPPDLLFF